MITGYWKDGYYIPDPSVTRFEQQLGRLLGLRLCNSCHKPLGNKPRRLVDRRQYHPECFAFIEAKQ